MTGPLEQPSIKPEQSTEGSVKHAPLIQSPQDAFPAFQKTEQPQLKMQGDNIEVPPLKVQGWQNDGTARATNANFIEMSNPFQGPTLDVAGRKWTDLGAGQGDTRMLAQAAPPPRAGDRTVYDSGQNVTYDLGDGQGPAVVKYSDATVRATSFSVQQFTDAARGAFNILANAVEGVGQALWALTPFRNSVNNGRLGCAASVSEVLQRSGYNYANSAGVGGLEGQLMRNGWTKAPLSQAEPEDVVMVGRSPGWRAGGGSAHVGIVGENGTVYHNSSSRGQWVKDNLQARFGRGGEMFVLKPPGGGKHSIDPKLFFECNPEPSAQIAPTPRYWTASAQEQPTYQATNQGERPRGYRDRPNDRGITYTAGLSDQDRFQPREDRSTQPPPGYEQRERDDQQYADSQRRRRMASADTDRGFQQRMMDRVRRLRG